MDNKDFSNIGEQIRNTVQSAIDSMDFQQLNRNITDTVGSALEETRKQINLQRGRFTRKERQDREEDESAQEAPTPVLVRPKPPVIKVNQVGKTAGILYIVFGSIGIGLSSLTIMFMCAVIVFAGGQIVTAVFLALFLSLLAGIFFAMLGVGNTLRGRLKRVKTYLSAVDGHMYCSIQEIADRVGKKSQYVAKDLRKMIHVGILPEAYLDEKGTCLMLSRETYKQYQKTQETYRQRQQADHKQCQDKPIRQESLSAELEAVIVEGERYLKILRDANDAIPGEIISAQLYRLEAIISRIFESVKKHPKQLSEMQRFMEYYLPTTIKLVNAYRDFDSVNVPGENISTAKKEIEQTLYTINHAFEHLLDDLYQDAAFDISTDASVLQTMLEKDGWTGSDFN